VNVPIHVIFCNSLYRIDHQINIIIETSVFILTYLSWNHDILWNKKKKFRSLEVISRWGCNSKIYYFRHPHIALYRFYIDFKVAAQCLVIETKKKTSIWISHAVFTYACTLHTWIEYYVTRTYYMKKKKKSFCVFAMSPYLSIVHTPAHALQTGTHTSIRSWKSRKICEKINNEKRVDRAQVF